MAQVRPPFKGYPLESEVFMPTISRWQRPKRRDRRVRVRKNGHFWLRR
jgi:hypothetical protein